MKKLSKKGYKNNSPDKNNPYNIIPGGNITMNNVPFDVMGISLDTGQTQHMTPNNNYYFPNTDYVFEYPIMQMGGPIIVNNANDPRLLAYNDSLAAYNYNDRELRRLRKTHKSPAGRTLNLDQEKKLTRSQAIDDMVDFHKKIGINLSKKEASESMSRLDRMNRMTNKPINAVSYNFFPYQYETGSFKSAVYKKPVQEFIYEPIKTPNSIPIVETTTNQVKQPKDTPVRVISDNINSNKQWEFSNEGYKILLYKDNTGKEINREYYDYSGNKLDNTNNKASNKRVVVGFQPNYTTYKYDDGSTKYQDMNGNLYNTTEELQGYLDGLVKMKNGGPLNKFVGNYAQKQINLSQAPQGLSMDQFLTDKNMEFIEFISDNVNGVLKSEEKRAFKKFQMGGPQVILDDPNNPLQPRQPEINNSFYNGPFGPYGQQNTPEYINQFTQQYNYPTVNSNTGTQSGLNLNPIDQNTQRVSNPYRNENIADAAMLGTQGINGLFNRARSRNQEMINSENMAIYNTVIPQQGSRGDYDINLGVLRPNQYTSTSFKKGGQKSCYKAGGEYKVTNADLGSLLSEGFEFEIID